MMIMTSFLKDGRKVWFEALDREGRLSCPDLDRVRDLISQPQDPWFSDRENVTLFDRVISGEESENLGRDYLFLARIDQEPVGGAWYQVASDAPEIGACAFVFTHPSFRGIGVSHELMKCLVDHFGSGGGLATYLGTSNPIAQGVYRKVGFEEYNGVVMRRLSPRTDDGRFDDEFCVNHGQNRIREARWEDLSRLVALYAYRHPGFIKDYGDRLFSHPDLPQQRCVTVPVALLLRAKNRNKQLLVIEDSRKSIGGAVSIYKQDSTEESCALDFLVLPSYMTELRALLERGCDAARDLGDKYVEAFVSDLDQGKKGELEKLGFARAGLSGIEKLPSKTEVSIHRYRKSL